MVCYDSVAAELIVNGSGHLPKIVFYTDPDFSHYRLHTLQSNMKEIFSKFLCFATPRCLTRNYFAIFLKSDHRTESVAFFFT